MRDTNLTLHARVCPFLNAAESDNVNDPNTDIPYPQGAFCPDGDLFVPVPDGSEWEIIFSGARGLDAVKRLVSCPPGYYMLRDERYPLEDQCLRCDANTYLLDQSNFSACLSCPVGATCAGGDDVSTLPGYWRQPDDWVNNWTYETSTRRSNAHLWNERGEMPPFLLRVAKELRGLSAQLGLVDDIQGEGGRRNMGRNVTRRPRNVLVHKCLPGTCSKNNVCNMNRTGPACGLCPHGWADTAAGCEWCPPPDDPGMLLLQLGVFIGGGLVGLFAYVLVSWTPLMNGIPMPAFIANAIMMALGVDPDEDEAHEVEEVDENEVEVEAAATIAHGAAIGAQTASQNNLAANAAAPVGSSEKKASVFSRILQRLPKIPMPKGGIGKFLRRIKNAFNQLQGKITKMLGIFSIVSHWAGKIFGGMSWFTEFAAKHKLNVHLKILVSYVQVLGSFVSFNVEWPSALTTLMNDVSSLLQFNVVELPKLSCLWASITFERTLVATTAGPIAIAFLFALPIFFCWFKALCFGWTPERLAAWEAVLDRFFNNILFGAFLIYPIASLICLQAFNCHSTLGVINADFRMTCPPLFSFMGLYSLSCFFIYPLGVPCLFLKLMKAMKVPDMAREKIINAGFFDLLLLFSKMNGTLECKQIAQIIGKIEDDEPEFERRIQDLYRRICLLERDDNVDALVVIEFDLALHRAVRRHFRLEDHQVVDNEQFDCLIRKILHLSHAFTGVETIDTVTLEQADLLLTHHWPSAGAKVAAGPDKAALVKSILGKGKKIEAPAKWESPFGSHFPDPKQKSSYDFYHFNGFRSKGGKEGDGDVAARAAEREAEAILLAVKRLELQELVLRLLKGSVISISFLTWEPESKDKRERDAIRRLGTIFGSYQVQTWFWELCEMLRKFVMVGSLVFISPGEPAQLGVALLLTLGFLFAHLMLLPFSTKDLNAMQAISQASLAMTLFVGLMMIIDSYIKKESDLAASGPWGVDVVDPAQERNRLIFSLFAVVVNFTTMVMPPMIMANNLRNMAPSPREIPGLIRFKISEGIQFIRQTLGLAPADNSKPKQQPTNEGSALEPTAVASETEEATCVVSGQNRLPKAGVLDRDALARARANMTSGQVSASMSSSIPSATILSNNFGDNKEKTKGCEDGENRITNDEFRQQMLFGTRETARERLEDENDNISGALIKDSTREQLSKIAQSGNSFKLESDALVVEPTSSTSKDHRRHNLSPAARSFIRRE